MEGKLDPVAVREARKRLAATLQERDRIDADIPDARKVDDDGALHIMVPLAEFRLLLAFLDEGREASAPFAVVVADYKKQTQVESDPDYPMLGRIGWEEDPRPPQVRWRELDRLAAWSEAVSEPEGKNT